MLATLAGVFTFTVSAVTSHADVPDRHPQTGAPVGYYKVSQSTDPIFPNSNNKEWFLDFGNAIGRGQTSGTVAVSMRENPNIRVKLLVWQLYPETGTLVIGNQTDEGSRKAVALASWQVRAATSGLILERGNYQVSLDRALDTD